MSSWLTETPVAARCNWNARYGLFDRSLYLQLDDAGLAKSCHRPPRSRYSTPHTGGTPMAGIAKGLLHCRDYGLLHAFPQSHECLDQSLTKSIVCSLYCRQTTTLHHIPALIGLFFSFDLGLTGNSLIFGIHVLLQPRFWHINHPSNPSQGQFFE